MAQILDLSRFEVFRLDSLPGVLLQMSANTNMCGVPKDHTNLNIRASVAHPALLPLQTPLHDRRRCASQERPSFPAAFPLSIPCYVFYHMRQAPDGTVGAFCSQDSGAQRQWYRANRGRLRNLSKLRGSIATLGDIEGARATRSGSFGRQAKALRMECTRFVQRAKSDERATEGVGENVAGDDAAAAICRPHT